MTLDIHVVCIVKWMKCKRLTDKKRISFPLIVMRPQRSFAFAYLLDKRFNHGNLLIHHNFTSIFDTYFNPMFELKTMDKSGNVIHYFYIVF